MGTKDYVADFGAPTNGTSSCSAATARWRRYAWSNPGSTLTLPAHTYNTDGDPNLTWGMLNPTISASSGAKVTRLNIGTQQFPTGNLTPYRGFIDTAFAGQSQVTLLKQSDVSKFSVNQWIIVGGLELQFGATY